MSEEQMGGTKTLEPPCRMSQIRISHGCGQYQMHVDFRARYHGRPLVHEFGFVWADAGQVQEYGRLGAVLLEGADKSAGRFDYFTSDAQYGSVSSQLVRGGYPVCVRADE
jgi:hypothetical protein